MHHMAKVKILRHAAVLLAALAMLCLLPGWLSGGARAETSAAYFDYPSNETKLAVGESCRVSLKFRRPEGHGTDLEESWYRPTTVAMWDSTGAQVYSASANPTDPNYCVVYDKAWITDFFLPVDKPGVYTLGVKVPITGGTWEKITLYVYEDAGDFRIAGNCLLEYLGDGGAVTVPAGVTRIMDDAFANKGIELDQAILEGPNAYIFSNNDPVSGPKIVKEFIAAAEKDKKTSPITIKGGYMEGAAQSVEQIKALADILPREQLIAKIMGALNSQATALALVIKAIAEKKAEAGEQ